MLDVEIRPAIEADVGFIWATFRDSYRHEQPDMTNADYEEWMRARQPSTADTVVAHVAGEPGLLVGWAARDKYEFVLLYVYVRKERRREGIAKRLGLSALGQALYGDELVVRHLTRDGRRIKANHPGVRYVPR